ncbi:hypothetical protein KKC04_04100, partial [Patescibacteria group bacterium]|nr:hypothetical protein [Patescibacteria group bacterium]
MNLKKRKKGHPSYRILDDGSFKVYLRDGTSKVYSKFETEIIRREAESLFRIGRNVEGAKLLDDLLSGEIKVKGKKEAIYHFDKTAEGEIIPISPGTESVSIDYGSYKKVFYNINGSLTETVHSDESYNHNSVKLFEKQRAAIQSLRKLESLKDLMEDPKARRYAAVAGGTVGLMCLMSAAPAFASSMNGSSSADTNSYISPPLEQLVETQLPPPNMLPQDYSNKRLDLKTGKWVDREGYDGKESASKEDNSKAEKEDKKGFNPFSLGNLLWEVPVAILAGYGISKLIGTKPIQEEETVQIRAKIDSIVDSLTNENIPGARISYVYNGQTIPGTVGQYTNIAEIKKGTSITVEMIAEADNYVQRKILQAIMDGDENYTLNIAPRTKTIQIDGANYTFNYDTFVNEIVKNNIIAGLKPPANGVLNVHFTEDRDDSGERFRPEYINELKNVWNWVKDHYGGRITSINYVLNSDKTKTDIPGQGDIFISPSTKGHAASSSC